MCKPEIVFSILSWLWSNLEKISAAILAGCGLYGFLFALPNYIKQKWIDNLCVDAKEALGFLLSFEEALDVFMSERKKTGREGLAQATRDVFFAFRKLKYSLLFLRSRKEVPLNLIEKIDTTLNARIFKPFTVIDALGVIDENWPDKENEPLKEIEKLREALLNIYEMKIFTKK